jgi:hypothetical protein
MNSWGLLSTYSRVLSSALAFKDNSVLLRNSFELAEKQLRARGIGGVLATHGHTMRLPVADTSGGNSSQGDRNSGSRNRKIVVVTPGGDNWPVSVAAAPVQDEQEIVISIMSEIRENLAVEPRVDRWPDVPLHRPGEAPVKRFLVISSSHASKLGGALRKSGAHTDVIYMANWRITRDTVMDMTDRIHAKLEKGHLDAIIFCVWDNSIYYGMNNSGETKPAERDSNGNYHIEGDLITASKSALHAIKNCEVKLCNRYIVHLNYIQRVFALPFAVRPIRLD